MVDQDHTVFDCDSNQPGQVGDIEFGHQAGPMLFHGLDACHHFCGCRPVHEPLPKELQDFTFR